MTSGRHALRDLDGAIATARNDLKRAAGAASGDASALADLEVREIAAFAELARIRVDLLENGAGGAHALSETEEKVRTLLESQSAHLDQLKSAVEQAETPLDALEDKRRQSAEALDTAIAEHDAAAEKTRARLETDEAYQTKAAAVEEANAMTARSTQKLETARADRAAKGAAYEADVLFKYLHDRQYATSEYRAFSLFAMLDDWVAGLIDYRRHRLNYNRLLEIPERLAEHVERLDDAAEAAERSLEAAERDALKADGVETLRDAVAAKRAAMDAIDGEIAGAEKTHAEKTAALQTAMAGDAGPASEAHALMTSALKALSIPDLRRMANETATLEDDAIVEALIDIKREHMELEDAQSAARSSLTRRRVALTDLEDIRRRFKKARFDSRYSEFRSDGLMATLLAEFAASALSRDDFWRRLKKSHRTRRRDWEDDFGGEEWRDVFGLPQDWNGGDWRGGRSSSRRYGKGRRPIPRRRHRAPRVRFPKSSGGGGFRTGGKF
ncbi:MAG: hypothetical protein AAF224_02155 [Pseudomonadota bacterium]